MVSSYNFLILIGAAVIVGIVLTITLSLYQRMFSSQDYAIDVDPFKDPQNLFVTARVIIQNIGAKPLTNVIVNYGDGNVLNLGTLTPGQKVILSPPSENSLRQVKVTADNGISVTKSYRIPTKIPGMMGS